MCVQRSISDLQTHIAQTDLGATPICDDRSNICAMHQRSTLDAPCQMRKPRRHPHRGQPFIGADNPALFVQTCVRTCVAAIIAQPRSDRPPGRPTTRGSSLLRPTANSQRPTAVEDGMGGWSVAKHCWQVRVCDIDMPAKHVGHMYGDACRDST